MSASLKKRVYEIYEAFSAGNLDLLADTFDENVDFRSNAPDEVFSYLGHRRGKSEVVKTLWAVIEYRAILDSFEAVQQVLGREFEVNKNPKST